MYIKLIQTRPTLDCIIDTVAKVRNVGHVLIRSTRRYGKFVLARCEAAFIARLFGYTLKQIAAASGAIRSLGMVILEDHLRGCVSNAIRDKNNDEELIGQVIEIFNKFIK